MIILNSLVEALLQLLVFAVIPLIYFGIRNKRIKGFTKDLGFYKPPKGWMKLSVILIVVSFIISLVPLLYLKYSGVISSDALATNNFKSNNFGGSLIIEILLYAVVKTSLSEELFFRGFLGKRLIRRFGFKVGNSVQAILFGLLHGIAFIPYGILTVCIVVAFPIVLGYIFGWVNEKKSNGSILPSWVIHGTSNVIAPIIMLLWV